MNSPPGLMTAEELSYRASQEQIDYIMRGMASREEPDEADLVHPTFENLFRIMRGDYL